MDLTKKKCAPCEGGTEPFDKTQIDTYLDLLEGWTVLEDKKITKRYEKEDFKDALSFVSAIGEIAESEGHHPDLCIQDYKYVEVVLSTHAIGGLSVNDFIVAAKIDTIGTESET